MVRLIIMEMVQMSSVLNHVKPSPMATELTVSADERPQDVAESPGRNLVSGPFWSNNYKLDIVINARANRNIYLKGHFIHSSTFFKLCTF